MVWIHAENKFYCVLWCMSISSNSGSSKKIVLMRLHPPKHAKTQLHCIYTENFWRWTLSYLGTIFDCQCYTHTQSSYNNNNNNARRKVSISFELLIIGRWFFFWLVFIFCILIAIVIVVLYICCYFFSSFSPTYSLLTMLDGQCRTECCIDSTWATYRGRYPCVDHILARLECFRKLGRVFNDWFKKWYYGKFWKNDPSRQQIDESPFYHPKTKLCPQMNTFP